MYTPKKPADTQGSSRRGEAVFEGELAVLGLSEVLQMLCVGRQRLWMDVWSGEERVGSVVVSDGEILGCATMGYGGDEAFFALSRLRRGKFRVHAASGEDLVALPATERSWQELLLESARLQDESERLSTEQEQQREDERHRVQAKLASWRPPESGAVLIPFPGRSAGVPAEDELAEDEPLKEAPPTLPAEPPPAREPSPTLTGEDGGARSTPAVPAEPTLPEVDRLVKEATEAYLRRDHGEALRLFTEALALRPGDRKIVHNIERLKKRGK